MKFICDCGNQMDFGKPDNTKDTKSVIGFEYKIFTKPKRQDSIAITCEKCGATVLLFDVPRKKVENEKD